MKQTKIVNLSIQIERYFIPNNNAMLQALRVVLDLTERPIGLKINNSLGG